jgi:hypothetical protein
MRRFDRFAESNAFMMSSWPQFTRAAIWHHSKPSKFKSLNDEAFLPRSSSMSFGASNEPLSCQDLYPAELNNNTDKDERARVLKSKIYQGRRARSVVMQAGRLTREECVRQ